MQNRETWEIWETVKSGWEKGVEEVELVANTNLQGINSQGVFPLRFIDFNQPIMGLSYLSGSSDSVKLEKVPFFFLLYF